MQQFFLAGRYPSADEIRAVHQALVAQRADRDPLPLPQLQAVLDTVPGNKARVALKLLKDARLAAQNASMRYRLLVPVVEGGRFQQLARDYEAKSENDRHMLERMIFYAQTGFCRWRVLLEYFHEPLMEGERCGHCDNCLQPPVVPSAYHETIAVPALQAAPFKAGDEVRVPRYGGGRVEQVAGDEVKVVFPDGAKRSFVAEFVRAA